MSKYNGIGTVLRIAYGDVYEVAVIIPNVCPTCNPPVDIFYVTNPGALPEFDPNVAGTLGSVYSIFVTGIIGDTFIDDEGLNAAEFTIESYYWAEEMISMDLQAGVIAGFVGGALVTSVAALVLHTVLK